MPSTLEKIPLHKSILTAKAIFHMVALWKWVAALANHDQNITGNVFSWKICCNCQLEKGRGTGVCSVNGQLRAMMCIPSVKLNWFALSAIACSMLKEIVTDTPFPSVRTQGCWHRMTPYAEMG